MKTYEEDILPFVEEQEDEEDVKHSKSSLKLSIGSWELQLSVKQLIMNQCYHWIIDICK